MKRFVIERDIPGVGTLGRHQMCEAAQKSNAAARELGPDIQWIQSYTTRDRLYCVYLAKDETVMRKHANLSGLPASRISEVWGIIDPTTAAG